MQNETFFLTRDSRPQPGRATGGFAEPIAVAQVALVRFDQRADTQSLPTSFELAVDAHRSIGHEGNGQDWFQERASHGPALAHRANRIASLGPSVAATNRGRAASAPVGLRS